MSASMLVVCLKLNRTARIASMRILQEYASAQSCVISAWYGLSVFCCRLQRFDFTRLLGLAVCLCMLHSDARDDDESPSTRAVL